MGSMCLSGGATGNDKHPPPRKCFAGGTMLEWHDLNARQEATILWLSAMLVIAAASSPDVRRSAYDLLTILLQPAISLLIVGLLANVAILTTITVVVGRKVGLWETLPIVTAIVWAFTAGFSLLLDLGDLLKGDNAFGKEGRSATRAIYRRSRDRRCFNPSILVGAPSRTCSGCSCICGVCESQHWCDGHLQCPPLGICRRIDIRSNRRFGWRSRHLAISNTSGLVSHSVDGRNFALHSTVGAGGTA